MFQNQMSLKEYMKNRPVTSVILLINLVMFLIVLFVNFFSNVIDGGSITSFSATTLVRFGALVPAFVSVNGEYYRLLTAMFLHGSILHFLANAIIGIYVLSAGLEKILGSLKFGVIYFLGGLGASLVVYYTSSPFTVTIGASGAIFAVLGSLLYIIIFREDLINSQEKQTITTLIILNIIFTFIGADISIAGHIGGFSTGFLLSFLLIKRNTFKVIN